METHSHNAQLSAEEATETADIEPASGAVDLANLGAEEQRKAQASFAKAAQQAQRQLTVLVEGLAVATNSAFNSQVNQGQGER